MDVRPSPIAGKWYPADPDRLRESVDALLDSAPAEAPKGDVLGLLAPHAGHRYSGRIAASAFRLARGLPVDTVAVLSPMHHPYRDPLLTTAHEAYGTPLGAVPVDREAVEALSSRLRQTLGAGLARVKADPEHSLEIELPFLQRVLGSFRLVPVMLRAQTLQVARALSEALAATLQDRRVLLVASSDLSHFYSQSEAEKFDREMLDRIEAFDPQGVLAAEEQGTGYACGRGAIAVMLLAARILGATHSRVVDHGTSGDATGDYGSVVGYGAAVVWKEGAT